MTSEVLLAIYVCIYFGKVTPVKSIYLLNVVVKQQIIIKHRKQNRRHIVLLSGLVEHSRTPHMVNVWSLGEHRRDV